MNAAPILTLPDGSQLLVSTQYFGESEFACELYLLNYRCKDLSDLQLVSKLLDAQTCREAQAKAYSCARRLYPKTVRKIKAPPYLIWPGPNSHIADEHRNRPGWRYRRSKTALSQKTKKG
ncbi:MAG: hypothetical protein C4293_11625 [Nitrospiraceae bacterium]